MMGLDQSQSDLSMVETRGLLHHPLVQIDFSTWGDGNAWNSWFKKEEQIAGDNMKYEWNDIVDSAKEIQKEKTYDIPQYGDEDGRGWPEGKGLWGFIKHFKWNLNLFLVGIPWVLIMLACIGWNLYMNIAWF